MTPAKFLQNVNTVFSPDFFTKVAAVTPSDSTDLTDASRLYIGVTGDVAVNMVDGSTGIFKAHPVGYLPGIVARVLATGTTATNILALS